MADLRVSLGVGVNICEMESLKVELEVESNSTFTCLSLLKFSFPLGILDILAPIFTLIKSISYHRKLIKAACSVSFKDH